MSRARRRGSSCRAVVHSRCGCACRDSTTCATRLRRWRWCTSWGRGGGGYGGAGRAGDARGGGGGDGASGRRRVHLGGGRYHACRTGAARTPRDGGGGGGGGVTRRWPRWRQRALLGVAGSGLLVLSWLGAPSVLRRLAMFRVRQIELVGVRNLAPDAVIAALRLGPRASVFGDTRLLADRVRGLAGVAEVRVVRRLPAVLSVELREVEPAALVDRRASGRERGLVYVVGNPARRRRVRAR